jgi:hypothetical protein
VASSRGSGSLTWRTTSAGSRRRDEAAPEARRDVIRGACETALAEAGAPEEPLPSELAALDFLKEVGRGMKERGELT